MWDQTRVALEFFQTYLPFARMLNRDELVSRGYCLAEPGSLYALYLPDGGTAMIDLGGQQGAYEVSWYDPRHGGNLKQGSIPAIEGGKKVSIGAPPDQPQEDWTILIRRAASQ